MRKLAGLAILILVSTGVFAQLPTNQYFSKEIPQKANKEFQFIAFYINQAVTSNIYPENDFLKCSSISKKRPSTRIKKLKYPAAISSLSINIS